MHCCDIFKNYSQTNTRRRSTLHCSLEGTLVSKSGGFELQKYSLGKLLILSKILRVAARAIFFKILCLSTQPRQDRSFCAIRRPHVPFRSLNPLIFARTSRGTIHTGSTGKSRWLSNEIARKCQRVSNHRAAYF